MRVQRELQIRAARRSAGAFIEYALRNESDDSKLKNAPFHWEWQEFWEENRYAVLIAPVEHGKSFQVVGKLLWMLGKHPEWRGAIISNTSTMAEKMLRHVRTEIERNPRVREVFPHLKPSSRDEDPWHSSAITVERKTRARDPSLQALGLYGAIVGSRLDFVVLDDVLDFENTRTEEQRKKAIEWFDSTVLTRLLEGAICWLIGTPWHPDDLLHDVAKRPAFAARRYSAVLNPDEPSKRWRTLWPEQWGLARLLERMSITLEHVFTRKYLCRVRLDATSRFKQIWLDRMCALGKGRTFLPTAPRAHVRGPQLPCFTGVDLAVGKKKGQAPKSALTSIFTIALMQNSRRLVVEIESGRWQSPEIVDRLVSNHRRYGGEILVEDNGAQQFLLDACDGRVPVRGWTTSAHNKFDPDYGVESLAVEIRNGEWVMPSGSDGKQIPDEGHAWHQELLYFDPEAHVGDRVMASWLARECLRMYSGSLVKQIDAQRR